jgi:hypothetical protein
MLHAWILDRYPLHQPGLDQLTQMLSDQLGTCIHVLSALPDGDEFSWFHDIQEGL